MTCTGSCFLPDKKSYRLVVAWLEDQIVRRLSPTDREGLRKVDSGDEVWEAALASYLKALGCPDEEVLRGGRRVRLTWLTGVAVKLHYASNGEERRVIMGTKRSPHHFVTKPVLFQLRKAEHETRPWPTEERRTAAH